MAELATIARPYARAAFEYARANDALGSWSPFLAAAGDAAVDPRLSSLIDDPALSADQLAQLIATVIAATGIKLGEGESNFLKLVADAHRLPALPDVAQQFEGLKAEAERAIDVQVTSAMALTGPQRERLAGALARRLSRTVRIQEAVDPELLAGAVVRAGDLVIDGSLRSRVGQLAEQMTRD
jgi:F-type H+-transporting ATPase subunit delta